MSDADALHLTLPWPLPLRRLLLNGKQALRHGEHDEAAALFRQALRQEPNIPEAHLGLALALRPGPNYLAWLEKLHHVLKPKFYMEIGVETGRSLKLAEAGTNALGIDPAPCLPPDLIFSANTQIEPRTSQAFFSDQKALSALPGTVDFAFIDGDHCFPSVLHDFIAMEALSTPGTVIALHDTWPLDALTAGHIRKTGFYTGDGWKIIPCLRAIRPDLQILTIPTSPTGLTLITGLDPESIVLRDRYQIIVETYANLPYRQSHGTALALSDNNSSVLDQIMAWRAMATAKSSRQRPVSRK